MTARLLPAAGRPGPARRVPRASRRRLARDARARSRHPAAATTRSSCATTACSSATTRPTTSPPRRRRSSSDPRTAALGGRDGRVLRRPRRRAVPTRAPRASPRCSTSKTSSPHSPTPPTADHAASDADTTDQRHRTDTTRQKAATREHHLRTARQLEQQAIELPSWAFGNSGTRFKVFAHAGHAARPVREDRGCRAGAQATPALAPTVALHIPWDKVDGYDDLARARRGPRRRARHDQLEHLPGRRLQVRRPHPRRRRRAPEGDRPPLRVHRHHARDRLARPEDLARRRHRTTPARPTCAAARTASHESLADDLRAPRRRAAPRARVQVLRAGVLPHRRSRLGHDATPRCAALGDKAMVCLDTGHHAPGTNIEFIVMQLLRLGKLGSFDFNSRFYADDDLIVGAADPFQLFRIIFEVIRGGGSATTPTSRSCSTSATTSRTRSPARSARCSTCRR